MANIIFSLYIKVRLLIDKALKANLDISPESRARPRTHSRAAPSVEAHHHVNGPKYYL